MKPESVVLQGSPDLVSATLANGVKCGVDFRRMTYPDGGWPTFIDMTGRLFSTFPPDFDLDAITRIPTNDFTHYTGNAGKRILGLAINTIYPDQSLVLVDNGEDPDNPGAQECEILVGLVENTLHPSLQDIVRGWGLKP